MYLPYFAAITNSFIVLFVLLTYASADATTEANNATLQSYINQYLAEKASPNQGHYPEHNCVGSSLCSWYSHSFLQDIAIAIMGLPKGIAFHNGDHIFCEGHICAFLQDVPYPYWGRDLRYLIAQLLVECNKNACGSIAATPSYKLSDGMLTVNWVSDVDAVKGPWDGTGDVD